jgi:hypothetical protein
MSFRFHCSSCGETHEGMPTFSADAPLNYYAIPESERSKRCQLSSDDCVIDEQEYYVRGCIEIPVHGTDEPFVWGVWVSLSEASFKAWADAYSLKTRSHIGSFFGWLSAAIQPYPDTISLKTRVHLRDNGIRPLIELEPTDHPLAIEQREGISPERVAEIYALLVHGT